MSTFTQAEILYDLRVEQGERRLYALHPAGQWHLVGPGDAIAVLWDEVQAQAAAREAQQSKARTDR